ncbi:hypothetical protein [Cryptosporangium phraense]|uniref:Uncharacterized protein n=1 Tax=Cryptosporangium phraense TaxID=2593070 RepID=A0A545AX46_9ACTN|nr:hypothetical protein [Cryptosporangium phraense]TQS45902.1 hypothetical protein FL583_05220 [Cryptosporangium phraense]
MNDQWRARPESARALVVQSRADRCYLAVAHQHERVCEHCSNVLSSGLLSIPQRVVVQGINELDLFVTTLRRLGRACDFARASALPLRPIRQDLELFERLVRVISPLRNAFEHFDEAPLAAAGLGLGVNPDRLLVTFGDARLDTAELMAAASRVHAAIRSVVDPLAIHDVHWMPPAVDLVRGVETSA